MKDLLDYPDGATKLDPDEMEGLKFKHITTRGELNQLEQANIQEGFLWLKRKRNTDILNEEFIRQLHRKLFGNVWNWAGAFKKTGKNIGVDAIKIAVELRKLLDDTRYWIEHDTYPSLELAIYFHHRLVSIHAFPNGNGRHARIMADAILEKLLKAPPIDWAGGHRLETMNERRNEYISALRSADRGDMTQLLSFAGAQ
jgi:Fic-DOC domain mobile mystery protein B